MKCCIRSHVLVSVFGFAVLAGEAEAQLLNVPLPPLPENRRFWCSRSH